MRRRAPWIAFGLALAVVLGVMGWVTAKLLEMEHERSRAEQQAVVEDQIRLALWRLDSAVPPRLFREMAEVAAAAEQPPLVPPASPAGVRARFVFKRDGGVVWLSKPETDELEAMRAAVADAGLFDRLENPATYADATASVQKIEAAQGSYLDNRNQQARSGNEWNKRREQLVDNMNTIEQAAQIGKRGRVVDSAEEITQSLGAKLGGYRYGSDGKPGAEMLLGVPEAIWIDGRLVVTRMVRTGDDVAIHVSWLDWAALQAVLLGEIRDLLPTASFAAAPASTQDTARLLATLPVRLVPGALPEVVPPSWNPLRASLVVGWVFVLLATAAVAGLLLWSLSLSERRAAFVSAVTHELRTPLTTFRMYTEMLSEKMVEEKRDRYVATLRREADRLGHLVENVLSYARIEGGRKVGAVEAIATDDLVRRAQRRLEDRCVQARMELEVEVDGGAGAAKVRIDPTAAEQILFNLVDNAAKYAPSEDDPRIVLSVALRGRHVELRVRDFGPGIPAADRRTVFEPFAKGEAHAAGTQPGVGLGLALCRRLARQMGGNLRLEASEPGAAFVLSLPAVDG